MSEQKQETPRPLMLRQISAESYTTYPPDDKKRAACAYCMTRVHVSKLEAYTEDDD